jgi:CubicO group peptidase (beta-lactamase class C family)
MNFEQTVYAYITAEMQRKQIPGLSVAVVKDSSTVLEKSYGFASVELRVPATSDTVYEIASVTKSFTAAAILLLAEKGMGYVPVGGRAL